MGDVLAWVSCQPGKREWCANLGKIRGVLTWVAWVGVLKLVALVILEEIPGCCVRQYRAWRVISQTLS